MAVLGEQLRNNDRGAAQRLLSSSLGLAALCGVMACVAMIAFPEQLVTWTGVRDAEVVSFMKVSKRCPLSLIQLHLYFSVCTSVCVLKYHTLYIHSIHLTACIRRR